MITVRYFDMIEELRGFTIYNGDYTIIINSHLSASEKTKVYSAELSNIESGKYSDKLKNYTEVAI